MAPRKIDKTPRLVLDKTLPPRTRRGGESKYLPIVKEFADSGVESAFVEVDGVAHQAIAAGLKTALAQGDLSDTIGVTVRSGIGVWLVKKDNG